jgi:hypothetical protein
MKAQEKMDTAISRIAKSLWFVTEVLGIIAAQAISPIGAET